MPRNTSRRPAPPSSRPVPLSRSSSTFAAPKPAAPLSQTRQGEQPSSGGPAGGLLSNVASTAAGVFIGHSIGNFFGSSTQEPAPAPAPAASEFSQDRPAANSCAELTSQFSRCLEFNGGDLAPCRWLMDQLTMCHAAAQGSKDQ